MGSESVRRVTRGVAQISPTSETEVLKSMQHRGIISLVALCAFFATSLGPVMAQQATPSASPLAPVCTAGSSGIGDGYFPTMGNGGYDASHYDLILDLDVPTGEIRAGQTTMTADASLDLCAFNLDFDGLTVDAVTVNGEPAEWQRAGNEMTIAPATPLARGDQFVVDVRYHGMPNSDQPGPAAATPTEVIGEADENEGDQFGGGWFAARDEIFVAGEPAGAEVWYPVNGHPADKATYTLTLTVDDPFVTVANGVLTDSSSENGKNTSVWTARDPIASYLVTLHAGRLTIEEDTGPHGLPIRNAFAENVSEAQRSAFDRQPEILAYFESVFGPYPFEVAGGTVVSVPIGFALETQTLALYGLMPGPPGGQTPERIAQIEAIVVHELAHQWFGNSVTVLRWEDIWLNEGFASYAEALWIEETEGVAARDAHLASIYAGLEASAQFLDPRALSQANALQVLEAFERVLGRPIAERAREQYRTGLGAASDADLEEIPARRGLAQLAALGVPPDIFPGTGARTGNPGPEDLFATDAVYNRGGLTLHALRLEIGDEAFFALLRDWSRRYANGNVTTSDFIALAEQTSGRDLDPFFHAWLDTLVLPPLALETGPEATPAATPQA